MELAISARVEVVDRHFPLRVDPLNTKQFDPDWVALGLKIGRLKKDGWEQSYYLEWDGSGHCVTAQLEFNDRKVAENVYRAMNAEVGNRRSPQRDGPPCSRPHCARIAHQCTFPVSSRRILERLCFLGDRARSSLPRDATPPAIRGS
jgi:hypothetical protein